MPDEIKDQKNEPDAYYDDSSLGEDEVDLSFLEEEEKKEIRNK